MPWLNVCYRVRAATDEIDAIAQALALEQSVEVPLAAVRDPSVAEHIVGRVASIRSLDAARFEAFEVNLQLALDTTGLDVAQTINMLFGNSSLHEHVELMDAELPAELLHAWRGPRFGINGLRELVHAGARPLTCAALKPQGLSSETLATLCHTFACGGIDVVKDDHGLADQRYSPFAERVRACQGALVRANKATGRHSIYAPSLVGSPRALIEQARIVREEGIGMVLVAPTLIGMPAFAELVAEHIRVPVLAHPAYAGACRVAPPFLLGKLFRALGADAVIYPNFGGRFAYPPELCLQIAQACRSESLAVRPALPVPAGGMTVERVDELIEFYGNDVMLLIGGSLLVAGDALLDRTREFVAKVDASARLGVQ